MINIQPVAACLAAFIVRDAARTLVRFEAFDFLLSGVKTHCRAAAVTVSVCGIPDWDEDTSLHK